MHRVRKGILRKAVRICRWLVFEYKRKTTVGRGFAREEVFICHPIKVSLICRAASQRKMMLQPY